MHGDPIAHSPVGALRCLAGEPTRIEDDGAVTRARVKERGRRGGKKIAFVTKGDGKLPGFCRIL